MSALCSRGGPGPAAQRKAALHRVRDTKDASRMNFTFQTAVGPHGSRRRYAPPHHEGLNSHLISRPHPEEPAGGGRLEGWATMAASRINFNFQTAVGPHGSRRRYAPPHHEGLNSQLISRPHPEEPAGGGRLEEWATTRLPTRNFSLAGRGRSFLSLPLQWGGSAAAKLRPGWGRSEDAL